MKYVFAYGSNLCVERLRARTPSANVVAVGTLGGYSLRWHKRSRDGSGKCDAFATGSDRDSLWGVVYELTADDKVLLDGFEGLGEDYFEQVVPVRTTQEAVIDAVAYLANPSMLDTAARPYSWYKGFVTTGAIQHGFPDEYRAALEAVEALEDADAKRHAREYAVLEQALARLRDPR